MAFLRREGVQGLGRHVGVLPKDGVLVPLQLLYLLLVVLEDREFSFSGLAGLLKLRELYVQLFVGDAAFGSESQKTTSLLLRPRKLLQPMLRLAVRVAALVLLFQLDHPLQVGAQLFGVSYYVADDPPHFGFNFFRSVVFD